MGTFTLPQTIQSLRIPPVDIYLQGALEPLPCRSMSLENCYNRLRETMRGSHKLDLQEMGKVAERWKPELFNKGILLPHEPAAAKAHLERSVKHDSQ